MNSQEIRKAFITFFEKKRHQFIAGCPIVPENDPSLLFINAGMNQFKDVFLGKGQRDYQRAVNSQICVRVSGKHNDLEDVGRDSTHLTSFEMLGNWSFGDYYKEEAIMWAWELLTDVFNIPKTKLVATVFEDDGESKELWLSKTDINPNHVVMCDAKDNFWEMGATGPCGPCSELHVYLKDGDIPTTLTQDVINNGDFIELWNLVFIQYNRLQSGQLEQLPEMHVDTGAGLERIVAYLQNTPSNYQTDLFNPIIKKIETISGAAYYENDAGMPHRVLADHVRTLCFGIADNVMPSNEGRGYVLRRLLRRALRYAKKIGVETPILYQLVPDIIDVLGNHFSHLTERQSFIQSVIKAEEESFLETLSAGLQLVEKLVVSLKASQQAQVSGEDAFKLYDTYGFPVDLTQILAKENQLDVDLDSFHRLLEEQRQRSRASSQFEAMSVEKDAVTVTKESFAKCNLHLAEDLNVAKGGEARVISDPDEKVKMAFHHTGTHLLHEVLRQTLGTHVQQAGSLVDTHRLRFDFTHFESINNNVLNYIENEVNKHITLNHTVAISHGTLAEAKEKGAMALFGEKYDETNVRVVDIGGISIECCAGTHVKETGRLEHLKLISETAVATGTRRIEALVGKDVVSQYLKDRYQHVETSVKMMLKKMKSKNGDVDPIKSKLATLATKNSEELSIAELELRVKTINELEVTLGHYQGYLNFLHEHA